MRIYRFKTGNEDSVIGYVERQYPFNMYIKEDLNKYDYYATLIHEYIHYLFMKIFGANNISLALHLWFDMTTTLVEERHFYLVRKYYNRYIGEFK